MAFNPVRALQIGLQVLTAIEGAKGAKFKEGDAGLYVGVRELAKQLESRNPNIAQRCGYNFAIKDAEEGRLNLNG